MNLPLELAKIIFSGVIGAICGSIIVNFLTVRRDRAARRRAFIGYIASVAYEFKDLDFIGIQRGQLFSIQKGTVSGVRTECAKILHDIDARKWNRFEHAWICYCRLADKDVEPFDAYIPGMGMGEEMKLLFPNYERGRKRVVELLNELIECAGSKRKVAH